LIGEGVTEDFFSILPLVAAVAMVSHSTSSMMEQQPPASNNSGI